MAEGSAGTAEGCRSLRRSAKSTNSPRSTFSTTLSANICNTQGTSVGMWWRCMTLQGRQSQAYLVPAEFRSCAQAISASGSPESSPEMASRMEERISSRISCCCCLKTTHGRLAVDTSRTTLQKIRTTLLILQAKVLKQICLHRKVSLLFVASKAASPTLARLPFPHTLGRCTMTAGVADCLRGAGRECFCGMITLVCPFQTYIYVSRR